MKMTTIGHREMPHISLFILCKNGGIKINHSCIHETMLSALDMKGNHIFVGAY